MSFLGKRCAAGKEGRNTCCFSPESRVVKAVSAGLLACSCCTFPSAKTVVCVSAIVQNGIFQNPIHAIELTATGIAPDLHRTSLLIPLAREPITRGKCRQQKRAGCLIFQ